MSAIKSFSVQLSPAQFALFREAVRESESLGDCRLRGYWLHFEDYEGVQHTLSKLRAVRTETRSELRSWDALKRKIDRGVRIAIAA